MHQMNKVIDILNVHVLRRRIFKFFLVAFIATVFNYTIFYVLLEAFEVNYLISSGIGFFSGVLLGYYLNSRWTFNIAEKSRRMVVKYYTVYSISLGVSLLFMKIAVDGYQLDARLANILAICITFCTNYTGTKFWVFKNK